jgi:hypothetical protein
MAQLPGINKVNWHQVGGITKPGRHLYTFGWLTISAEDISIWEQYPNAVFTLVSARTDGDSSAEEYRLGTFELRQPHALVKPLPHSSPGRNARRTVRADRHDASDQPLKALTYRA